MTASHVMLLAVFSGRLLALDGLRAFAVLLVFAAHASPGGAPGGFVGVDVFFALSGYLITALLLAEVQSTGRASLRDFYVRRTLRLLPALVAVVVVATPVMAVIDVGRPLLDALAALLYLGDVWGPVSDSIGGGFAHTWSLALEEQFYLVWPLVLVVGLRRRWPLAGVVVAACLACSAAAVLLLPHVDPSALYRTPLPHVVELGAGALLALVLDTGSGRRRLAWLRRPAVPVVGLVALAALAPVLEHQAAWLYRGGFVLLGLGCAALVGALVLAPGGPASRALSWGPAVWLGRRSYGFYLWHYPVVLVGDRVPLPRPAAMAGALAVSLLAAALSWRFVEQPFLRRARRSAAVPLPAVPRPSTSVSA